MEVKATMKPGQNGTRKLIEKYGDRLVCVRYRYDRQYGKRYTTVELIEEESSWGMQGEVKAQALPPAEPQRLGIKVEYWETDLRGKVKAAGGIWRPRQKLWEMRYEDVVALGLENRVIAADGLAAEASIGI